MASATATSASPDILNAAMWTRISAWLRLGIAFHSSANAANISTSEWSWIAVSRRLVS